MKYKDYIYITNAGLGHTDYVILLKLDKNNYLTIDKKENGDTYTIGDIVSLGEYEVIKHNFDIEDSTLYKTCPFVFNYFIKNYFKVL